MSCTDPFGVAPQLARRLGGADNCQEMSDNDRPSVVSVVWSYQDWRCEHWITSTGDWLVLYRAFDVAIQRPVSGVQLNQVASTWYRATTGEDWAGVMPEPSRRRQVAARRRTVRGGRRDDDRQMTHDSADENE